MCCECSEHLAVCHCSHPSASLCFVGLDVSFQAVTTKRGFRSALIAVSMPHTTDSCLSDVPNANRLNFVLQCIVTSLFPHNPYYAGFSTNSTAHPMSATKKFKKLCHKVSVRTTATIKTARAVKRSLGRNTPPCTAKTTNHAPTPPPNLHRMFHDRAAFQRTIELRASKETFQSLQSNALHINSIAYCLTHYTPSSIPYSTG
jgi:hypothetical protein